MGYFNFKKPGGQESNSISEGIRKAISSASIEPYQENRDLEAELNELKIIKSKL
jgi:hypothetical protein